jgi:hypothetical protein
LAHVFFLAECFRRETFLFFDVSASIGESFGGETLPLDFISLSSPPCFTSSPPPPAGESDPISSQALSSSSVSMFCTSSFFFFFFTLVYPSCSTRVAKGVPMMSGSKSYAYSTSTRNSAGHYLVIFSISSSVNL